MPAITDPAPPPPKPIPAPDAASERFWAGARSHRLTIQYCPACEFFIHTPRSACPRCDRTDLDHRDVSGRGTLYSYTVMHDAPAPAFAANLPYVVGVVDLEEQDRLLIVGNIIGVAADGLRLGMPVSATFEDIDNTIDESAAPVALVHFRPIGD